MTVTFMTGFESRDVITSGSIENVLTTGVGSSLNTDATFVRTGSASFRSQLPATGGGIVLFSASLAGYEHFAFYIATMPGVAVVMAGQAGTNIGNLLLNTDGTISVCNNTTVIGTSTTALTTGRWYWIGWRNQASVTGSLLQINHVDQGVSGTTGSTANNQIGFVQTSTTADAYIDDVIVDSAGFLAPSKVALLVPVSDNAVGAGWALGTGTAISANSGSTAVKNTPPAGTADLAVGSDTKQIRNAASNLNAYAANLTTYTNAGVMASDIVLAVQAIFATAAPSATSPKSGSMTLSNPTIAKTTIGTFYNGSNVATDYNIGGPTSGWKITRSAIQGSPSVTLGSSPVLTATQDTSSTRIAMVCFMGVYVAWRPYIPRASAINHQNPGVL